MSLNCTKEQGFVMLEFKSKAEPLIYSLLGFSAGINVYSLHFLKTGKSCTTGKKSC